MLTLTAAVWFRFVHFGTPLGTPSPVCITDCPTRPLHVSVILLVYIPQTYSQQFTTLSFPPEASNCPSALHVNPHTSALCPMSSMTLCLATRTSWW